MKLPITFFLIILSACNSRTIDKESGTLANPAGSELAEISFKEYEFNFGRIAEGEKVAHIFAFENKGPGSLVISSASTSCGCTVTRYDKNPIPTGKGGSVEVVFDSEGRAGIQTKTVSVHSNSKSQVVILKITADVVPVDSR